MDNKGNIQIVLKEFNTAVQPMLTLDILIPSIIYNGMKEDKIRLEGILSYSKEICAWSFFTTTVDSNFSDKDWTYFINTLIVQLKDLDLTPSLNYSIFILLEFLNNKFKKMNGNKNYGFEYFTDSNAELMHNINGNLISWNCSLNRSPFTRNI